MPMQVDTCDYVSKNGAEKLSNIIKSNHSKKWFFNIGIGVTYSATGTFYKACESVKKYFKNSKQANYGIIKLSKIEDV